MSYSEIATATIALTSGIGVWVGLVILVGYAWRKATVVE
jgi:hypothetical protein